MIQHFENLTPISLKHESGKVFYSGKIAFNSPSALYILGINPGGNPRDHKAETVSSHTEWIRSSAPENWSAYRDESWEGCRPGRAKVQLRVLHLIQELGLDPGKVPASNVVFQRSKSKPRPKEKFDLMANECWPFHEAVIRDLEVRVILYFRGANGFLRERLGTDIPVTESRGVRVYKNLEGQIAIEVPHPSYNDWKNPRHDPSELVRSALLLAKT